MSFDFKKFSVGVGLGLLIVALFVFPSFVQAAAQNNPDQCNRNNPWNCPAPTQICNNGQHTGNPHCNPTATPTPTTKPTATPTPKCGWNIDHPCATPTPTPKPSCSPTPTPKICTEDHPCNTPTPTPTVSVTPSPTVTPTTTPTPTPSDNAPDNGGGGSSQNNSAPGPAVCEIPFQAPILQGFTADGNGSVTFSWWPSPNVSKYSITYGYSTDNMQYGEDNIPSSSTSITLNGLTPGRNVWAQVQAWQGGCEESSNLFDPIVR